MSEVLIVPDVHGLDFWKPAKEYDGEIIFLGDYLDPYDVSIAEALENFAEILAFREDNPNVYLLCGNHDYAYMYDKDVTRKCYDLIKTIRGLYNIFNSILGLFEVRKKIGNVTFSHAGISDEWLNWVNNRCDLLNRTSWLGFNEIWSCSDIRGGTDPYSSPLWLDLYEITRDEVHLSGFQVFGHTRLKNKGLPIKYNNVACVDNETLYTIDTGADNPIETLKRWK